MRRTPTLSTRPLACRSCAAGWSFIRAGDGVKAVHPWRRGPSTCLRGGCVTDAQTTGRYNWWWRGPGWRLSASTCWWWAVLLMIVGSWLEGNTDHGKVQWWRWPGSRPYGASTCGWCAVLLMIVGCWLERKRATSSVRPVSSALPAGRAMRRRIARALPAGGAIRRRIARSHYAKSLHEVGREPGMAHSSPECHGSDCLFRPGL